MELLLNLVWFALAITAVFALLHSRRELASSGVRFSRTKALVALGCMAVLLFPVISVSDDLHPSQAIFEDSSKRILHGVAASLNSHAPDCAILLTLLSILALFGTMLAQPLRLAAFSPQVLSGEYSPTAGRAPPAKF